MSTSYPIIPQGMTNINACCWWNSLLQVMLSCKHFVSTIIETTDSETKTYQAMKCFVLSQAGLLEKDQELYPCYCTNNITLLKIFLHELREKEPESFKIMASGQQSASEGFSLLIDLLKSNSINILFLHSYEQSIVKKNTNTLVSVKRTTNNFFSQFDESNLLKRGLKECLLNIIEDLKDYKLDTGEVGTCLKILKLKRISPIFVILLNRYKTDRADISLPETIVISHKGGSSMIFFKKACIDHSGGLGGGHYIARGTRHLKDGDSNTILFNDNSLQCTSLNTAKTTYMTIYESLDIKI